MNEALPLVEYFECELRRQPAMSAGEEGAGEHADHREQHGQLPAHKPVKLL